MRLSSVPSISHTISQWSCLHMHIQYIGITKSVPHSHHNLCFHCVKVKPTHRQLATFFANDGHRKIQLFLTTLLNTAVLQWLARLSRPCSVTISAGFSAIWFYFTTHINSASLFDNQDSHWHDTHVACGSLASNMLWPLCGFAGDSGAWTGSIMYKTGTCSVKLLSILIAQA